MIESERECEKVSEDGFKGFDLAEPHLHGGWVVGVLEGVSGWVDSRMTHLRRQYLPFPSTYGI